MIPKLVVTNVVQLMVSKAFFTGSKRLVEDNDGREDYVRFEGEKFLQALSKAGQHVVNAPFDADGQKAEYLKILIQLNERYFEAREFETEAKGKFYKHDEMSERRLRVVVSERLTDSVDDLRALLSAHDALVAAAVEYAESAGPDQRQTPEAIRSRLLACTDQALTGGWFTTVDAYYYSLSPGEIISEGRERRKQRIEGTESSRGIRELLGKFAFRKLSERDLNRIRELNVRSPGPDAEVWKRLQRRYSWYISYDVGRAASSDDREATVSNGEDGSASS